MAKPVHDPKSRYREVERIFNDMGWENIELIEEWDGEELAVLREGLDEEQYQHLLDELGEPDTTTR